MAEGVKENQPDQVSLPPESPKAAEEYLVKQKMRLPRLAILVIIIFVIIAIGGADIAYDTYKSHSKYTTASEGITNKVFHQKIPSNTTLSSGSASTAIQTNVLDVTKLPLGDGKVSNSPKSDYVYSCVQTFTGGGAQHVGSWIHGDTWNLNEKTKVEGDVKWPNAQFSIATNDSTRTITGNGLPVDTETGIFPIQLTDPAYQIDRNPNSIKTQNISFSLPLNPSFAASPSCVPMGMIGVAVNGVAIFNALDADGRDAVAHEVQDVCDGHPQSEGMYHYHGPSDCLPGEKQNNTLIGYALDGYGIYSMYNANGREITDADLDACHGTTSEILWNSKMVNMYHYVLTREYPYTVGCFKGAVAPNLEHMGVGGQQQTPNQQHHPNPPSGRRPPPSNI